MKNNYYQNGNNNINYQGNIKQYNMFYNSHNTNIKANNYSLSDYCQLSKPSKKLVEKFATIVTFIANIISIVAAFKSFILFFENLLDSELSETYLLIAFVYISFSAILFWILLVLAKPIFKSIKVGIYNKTYYKDRNYYKILLKRCPICNSRTILSNNQGTITFNCTKSANHSLSADITDLNIFINNSQ